MAENPASNSQSAMAPSNASKKSNGVHKVSAGKFEIDTHRPSHDFEHNYAEAYECLNSDSGQNDCVAIILKDRYPVRKDVIMKLFGNDAEYMINLKQVESVEWPDGSLRYALIYKRPEGNPLIKLYAQRREPLSEETVRRGIIRPMFQALELFGNYGLFHGNIRPSNIFMTSHDNAMAVLGECISTIPGIIQPILYETIERGMTDAACRGAGTSEDDIYAFGATLAVLMRGHDPMEGKTDKQIIEEKINRSSYSVLTDGLRLSPGLSEFLRATLNDDPKQRWDITQLAAWVDGNRTTPKSASPGLKAQRHLDFNGKKYIRPRVLAKDLYDNPSEAVILIENGNLAKWVERAIGDTVMVAQLNAATGRASTSGRTAGFEDRLLCYVSMALDPQAPIRYKNMRFMPSGVGHGLALAFLKNDNVQIFGEIIRERFAWAWLNQNANPNAINLLHTFDQASKLIVRRGIDYGLERCLYELCPDAPCLSDYFHDCYVADVETLLYALNKISDKHKDQRPLDRHIASFIVTHDTRDNSGLMTIIEGSDTIRKSLATITLYQQIQRRFNRLAKLPGLAEWLSRDAEIIVQRFRSIKLKQDILKQIPKEVASGNLTKIMSLIDSPVQVKKDETDYLRAIQFFSLYGRERDNIRRELTTNPYYGFGTGRQIALFMSMIMSALIVLATLVVHFGDKLK